MRTRIILLAIITVALVSCGGRQSAAEKAAKAAQNDWKRSEIETLQRYYEMALPAAKSAGIELMAPDADFLMLLDGQEFNDMVAKTRDTYKRFIP